jgi:hypothetical protein
MSKDSPRTMKDCYANVSLLRHDTRNPSESGERIEVVVRIPEEVAKTLAGAGRKPSVTISNIYRRAIYVAHETVGVPTAPLAITVGHVVDAVMHPSLPMESNFKDQDGVEAWICI